MLGWAETYLYGSASISVFMESAPGSGKVDVSIFKWAKAGWKGSNVVKVSHITAGLKRFTSGLRQVMESPRLPSSDAIAAKYSELKAMNDTSCARSFQRAPISPSRTPTRWTKRLSVPCSTTAQCPGTLKRDDAIAELMKLYMRQQLGTLPAAVARID